MKIFQYPVVHFNFHDIGVHFNNLQYSNGEYDNSYNISHTVYKSFFLEKIENAEFLTQYKNFTKYVGSLFESAALLPQERPFFRVHNNCFHPRFFGSEENFWKPIGRKSKLVYVPITPMFYTNSFSVESKPRLKDFNFVNLNIGQLFLHDCEKDVFDSYINHTGTTSICMMFGFTPHE